MRPRSVFAQKPLGRRRLEPTGGAGRPHGQLPLALRAWRRGRPAAHTLARRRKVTTILRVALLCCSAVALGLGLFAAAGDRIGLWDPVKPPPPLKAAPRPKKHVHPKKHVRTKQRARAVVVSSARTVRPRPKADPPVQAGTAFEFSALLAALAAVLGVGRRMAFGEAQALGQPRRRTPRVSLPSGPDRSRGATGPLRSGRPFLRRLLRFVGRSLRDVGTSAGRVAQASAQTAGQATGAWIAQYTERPRREELVFVAFAVLTGITVGCLVVTFAVR
jgi:hypothetical protein